MLDRSPVSQIKKEVCSISFFDKLLGGRKPKAPPPTAQRIEVLPAGVPSFVPFSGNAYEDDIYRSGIHAIARNAGKLKGTHVVKRGDQNEPVRGDRINRILQIAPHPYMTAYDMLYKLTTHLILYNNAFALLDRDDRGELRGVYPFQPLHVDLIENYGVLLMKCFFQGGKEFVFPYSDVIHLRRNFNANDFFGDPNTAIFAALELSHIQNEGQKHATAQGAQIRGVVQFNNVVGEDLLNNHKAEFVEKYLSVTNNGGIIPIDTSMNYIPIDSKPMLVDEGQLKAIKDRIYGYLGLTEAIVSSDYTEAQWSAFYESVLEPIAVQLGLEFTRKLFSDREQAFGNAIVFDSGRLQFSSNQTKIRLIESVMPLGLLTINQGLEILNLPPVEGGDERPQSLNFIDTDIADQYQLGGRRKTRRRDIDDEGNQDM